MRKRHIIPAVALSLLLGTSLIACGVQSNDEQSGEKTKTDFKVSVKTSSDYEVKGLKDSYKAGDTVSFTIVVKSEIKIVTSVRADSTKVNAVDGVYSFTMPEKDVDLKITIMEKEAPVFDVTYSGKLEEEQTITISAKVDNIAFEDFEISAISGSDLVEIDGKSVKLLSPGDVTLKASATKDGFSLSDTIEFTIAESEAKLGTNIFYNKKKVSNGIEANSRKKAGQWLYWAGDGGSVSSFKYDAENDLYTLNYGVGWAWYGVQFWNSLPYAENGDTFALRWDVETDNSGKITICGKTVELNEGANSIAIDIEQKAGATLGVQMGSNDDGEVAFSGSVLKFSTPRLYDRNKENIYHKVTFSADSKVLDEIQVKEGKTVTSPVAPKAEGKIFSGFYDGETKYTSELAIDKEYNFVAKYIDETEITLYTVNLYNGELKLASVSVPEGSEFAIPEDLKLPFGRSVAGIYQDKDLATEYSLSTPITGNIDLFVKLAITPESTYTHDVGLGNKIPDEWLSNEDDGTLVATFNGWGSSSWHVQVNFTDSLPIGEEGETYTIEFEYSIDKEGADVKIYDTTDVDVTTLEVGEHLKGSLSYEGGILSGSRKITFELGGTPVDEEVTFKLHDISAIKNEMH